jgi:uncharacterized membrane protein YvlD (DUF360 family)
MSEKQDQIKANSAHFPMIEQGRGSTILLLGILSIILAGLLLGIPAWVMGNSDLKKIKSGKMSSNDRAATLAGMVFGIIGTFINPLLWILAIVLLVGVIPWQ